MAFLIRIIVVVIVLYLCYRLFRYLVDPKRKFDAAVKNGIYYFYDDVNNIRKNFFITMRSAVFEGEKYIGTAEDAREVASIFIWADNPEKLHGFTKDDFHFLEKEIRMHYPKAQIDWKNPIEQLMKHQG